MIWLAFEHRLRCLEISYGKACEVYLPGRNLDLAHGDDERS